MLCEYKVLAIFVKLNFLDSLPLLKILSLGLNDATLQTMNYNISKLLEDLAKLAREDTSSSTVPQVSESTHEILNDLNIVQNEQET